MSPDEIENLAEQCIARARDFWMLDPKWRIYLDVGKPSVGAWADVQIEAQYYAARITISPDVELPETVWKLTAHEMAHVALAPMLLAEWSITDRKGNIPEAFSLALEQCTTGIEHVFLQHHPHPVETTT